MIPEKILTEMRRNDKAMDELLKKYGAQIKAITPKLVEFIQQHQDSDGKFRQGVASAKFVKKILSQMGSPLTSGIDKLLSDAGAVAVESFNASPGAPSFMVGQREIATVVSGSFDELTSNMLGVSKDLQSALKSELLQLSLVPKSIDTSAKVLSEVIGKSIGQAKSIVNTGMSAVQRDLHEQALDALPEDEAMVLYLGPDDGETRGFCAVLAGLAIKKADIAKLKNGQRGASNVLRHGGGWNCRHRLLPITADFAEAQGMKIAKSSDITAANNAARA